MCTTGRLASCVTSAESRGKRALDEGRDGRLAGRTTRRQRRWKATRARPMMSERVHSPSPRTDIRNETRWSSALRTSGCCRGRFMPSSGLVSSSDGTAPSCCPTPHAHSHHCFASPTTVVGASFLLLYLLLSTAREEMERVDARARLLPRCFFVF